MDLSQEELLCRKDTLKQFENYIENATNTLNNFVEQLGWSLDETPTDVVSCNFIVFHLFLVKLLYVYVFVLVFIEFN